MKPPMNKTPATGSPIRIHARPTSPVSVNPIAAAASATAKKIMLALPLDAALRYRTYTVWESWA
jgi:hypothetical protein